MKKAQTTINASTFDPSSCFELFMEMKDFVCNAPDLIAFHFFFHQYTHL